METQELPESWQSISEESSGTDRSARWAHTDEPVLITAGSSEDDDGYSFVVEQMLSGDDHEAVVTTDADVCSTWSEVESRTKQVMDEVDAGERVYRLMDTRQWRSYVQFFAIRDGELPDGVTADALITATEEDPYETELDTQINYEDADVVVDVFTRIADETHDEKFGVEQ